MTSPKQLAAEILEKAEMATPGTWDYPGIIGDPGQLLFHAVTIKEPWTILCKSEEFNLDYSGGDRNFKYIASANPTNIKSLLHLMQEAMTHARDYMEGGYQESADKLSECLMKWEGK